MEANKIVSSNSLNDPEYERRWQTTRDFLTGLQDDFQGTRERLEQVNSQLAQKESLLKVHLQQITQYAAAPPTLRLVSYNVGSLYYRLGESVLGGVMRPLPCTLPTRIKIRCLGRFEARSASGQIEHWHSVKAKSVFQYLLVKPHEPTHKDALIEALWPGGTGQASNNNLKAAIHSLRLNLSELSPGLESPPIVLFSESSYRLNPDVDLSIDVEEFEKYRANGRRLEKERCLSEAMSEFEKAENLYQGDYLEDEPYEEWTLLKRETLKDNYLIILSKLADYCLKTFNYEDCISYSQKILTKDPCREDAYRNLIYCHLRLNQKNRALRWYEICCQKIKTELDTTPEKETLELGQSLYHHPSGRE
jgi:DNA-binding SARP family transcriptional activator